MHWGSLYSTFGLFLCVREERCRRSQSRRSLSTSCSPPQPRLPRPLLSSTVSNDNGSGSDTSSSIGDDSTSSSTSVNKYEALLDWLRSTPDAIVSDAVVLQPSLRVGGGYGAFVTTNVNEGDLLFAIPRTVCITVDNALQDAACGALFKALVDKAGPGGSTVALAGFIAKERLAMMESSRGGSGDDSTKGTSRYGPYLDTLPWERGVNNQEHVLYWSKDEAERLLTGTMCYGEAMDLRKEVALAIQVLDTIIGRSRDAPLASSGYLFPWQRNNENNAPRKPVEGLPEAVKAAFVCLLTRAFQDEMSSSDSGDSSSTEEEKLVPLLDMLQHSDEPNVSHVMRKDSGGTVEVRARRALQPNEELVNQYRSEREENMPYHRFFTRFGFVPGIQEPMQDLLQDESSIFFAQKAEV